MIHAGKRTLAGPVYLIGNYHDIACLELRIQGAGSVCENEGFYAQILHYPHSQANLRRSAAFIKMATSLLDDGWHMFNLAYKKAAFMGCHARCGKFRNIRKGNCNRIAHHGCDRPKAGAKNKSQYRGASGAFHGASNKIGAVLDFCRILHSIGLFTVCGGVVSCILSCCVASRQAVRHGQLRKK